MTDADVEELRAWADVLAPAGCRQARLVQLLLAGYDARGRLLLAAAERIAGQSEILARRAACAAPEGSWG